MFKLKDTDESKRVLGGKQLRGVSLIATGRMVKQLEVQRREPENKVAKKSSAGVSQASKTTSAKGPNSNWIRLWSNL